MNNFVLLTVSLVSFVLAGGCDTNPSSKGTTVSPPKSTTVDGGGQILSQEFFEKSREELLKYNLKSTLIIRVDLSGKNLRGLDFSGALLEEVRFRKADLSGSNFRKTKLSGVDFRGSTLDGVNFNHALLKNVDFSWAKEVGSTWFNTTVGRNVIFWHSSISCSDIRGVHFTSRTDYRSPNCDGYWGWYGSKQMQYVVVVPPPPPLVQKQKHQRRRNLSEDEEIEWEEWIVDLNDW